MPLLALARRRDVFLKILEHVRAQFDFVVWGYVVVRRRRSGEGWSVNTPPFAPSAKNKIALRKDGNE